MNPTDVVAVRAPLFDATPDPDVPFTSGGTQQLVGGAGDNSVGGRIKGWWILCNAETPDGACFIDLHDGSSTSDPIIVRIGVGKGGHDYFQTQAAMEMPGNGLRFVNGIFLKCTPIAEDGTFYQIELFYQ